MWIDLLDLPIHIQLNIQSDIIAETSSDQPSKAGINLECHITVNQNAFHLFGNLVWRTNRKPEHSYSRFLCVWIYYWK